MGSMSAREMDRHHGLGQTALLGALGQRLRQQGGIHVPGEPLAVDEGRPAAHVEDGVGAGHEGEGGDRDLIAWLNAGQVQRGRARTEGQGVVRADFVCKIGLERVDMRTKGSDPVGCVGSAANG